MNQLANILVLLCILIATSKATITYDATVPLPPNATNSDFIGRVNDTTFLVVYYSITDDTEHIVFFDGKSFSKDRSIFLSSCIASTAIFSTYAVNGNYLYYSCYSTNANVALVEYSLDTLNVSRVLTVDGVGVQSAFTFSPDGKYIYVIDGNARVFYQVQLSSFEITNTVKVPTIGRVAVPQNIQATDSYVVVSEFNSGLYSFNLPKFNLVGSVTTLPYENKAFFISGDYVYNMYGLQITQYDLSLNVVNTTTLERPMPIEPRGALAYEGSVFWLHNAGIVAFDTSNSKVSTYLFQRYELGTAMVGSGSTLYSSANLNDSTTRSAGVVERLVLS